MPISRAMTATASAAAAAASASTADVIRRPVTHRSVGARSGARAYGQLIVFGSLQCVFLWPSCEYAVFALVNP